MTNNYEILYIIAGKYSEDELGPLRDKVRDVIVKAGGNIIFDDIVGKKKLTFPIKKVHQGYYVLSEFTMDGEKLEKLNTELKLTDEILRHLIVKKKIRSEKEILAQKRKFIEKSSRSDDDRPFGESAQKKSKPVVAKKDQSDDDKIKLKDLDQKLDEILDENII